jgi:hypothetical protein
VTAAGFALAALVVAAPGQAAGAASVEAGSGAAPLEAEAGAAVDTHGYPRTFHLWGAYRDREILARYDMLVGYPSYDVQWLRSQNPRGIFLLQPELYGRSGWITGVTYGAAHVWRGGCDRSGVGVQLGCLRAWDPDSDYLWNADGTRATVGPSFGHYGWNLADPRGRGTAELVAKIHAYAAEESGLFSRGWTGIYSDNWIYSIGESWFYGSRLDTDRDGNVDDYGVLRRNWSNGLVRAGHTLRRLLPGKIVGGNGIWYDNPGDYAGDELDGWLRSANFMMVEHFDRFFDAPDSGLSVLGRWLSYPDPYGQPRYAAVIQRALRPDGERFCVERGSNPNRPEVMLHPDVLRSMRWGLTLTLMTGAYYEIHVGCPTMHHTRWWFDEYDGGLGIRRRGYLGRPLGGPVRLAPGVYRRDFQHGVVINNSSGGSRTVNLRRAFWRLRGSQNPSLNDGHRVRRVTVPARDGIILLRRQSPAGAATGGTSPPPPLAPPPPPAATGFAVSFDGLQDGQTVRGSARWYAEVSGGAVRRVEFLVDGELRWTERSAPFGFKTDGAAGWDTTREPNGLHTLTIRAVGGDGRTATASIQVRVAN